MAKIISDLSGDLKKSVFYSFELMYDDVPYETPTPEWTVAPRTPTNDVLFNANQPDYLYLDDRPRNEELVETKDCPANANHVTLQYYKTLHANLAGGVRIAPFVPTVPRGYCAVSESLHLQLQPLNVKGARLRPIRTDDEFHELKGKGVKLWHLQFVGRAGMRPWKLLDAPNLCPHCGQGKIFCESCGYRVPLCESCGQQMYVIECNHKGGADKRIPFERGLRTVLEGKTWDGSDLVQGCYASRRFIDWLLRIHAAPFYAEPVYFCVDGMSDQQKKWFDDLQKPFEA